MKNTSKNSAYLYEITNPTENPELKSHPFYHTNFKSSLENVFLKDNPPKETSLITRLFSNKTETLKSTAKSLLEEILLRETLDCHLLNKINEDISWLKNQFYYPNSLNIHYDLVNTKFSH